MKSFILTSILSAMMVPTFALACGSSSEDRAQTEQQLLRSLNGKTLSCTTDSETYTAVLRIYAVYRCINSPVYGVLNLENQEDKTIVQAVRDDLNGKIALRIEKSNEGAFCEVKESAQEAE